MIYGSVCSGIEAATVAWRPLGWRAAFFSEIEPFPSAVLAHHYPAVPNYGDMTRFREWPDANIDVLVGGTPCQSFSVAGLRKGLDDPRGNLALVYLALADRYRPRWLVWENVPGVLSSNGGRDFGAFLGGMAQLGYGWAYRVLDARYFGVPQRRRRVFVVGHLGDWRRAAAVLFERSCMSGHPAPGGKAREGTAPTIAARTRGGGGLGTDAECDGALIPQLARCVTAGEGQRMDAETDTLVPTLAANGDAHSGYRDADGLVAHSLRAEGFDANEDGTGRGTPLVPVAFDTTQITSKTNRSNPQPEGPCHPLAAGAHAPAVAFNWQSGGDVRYNPSASVPDALTTNQTPAIAFDWDNSAGAPNSTTDYQTLSTRREPAIMQQMAVRRLTPRECERLQGFPDDYTLIPYRRVNASRFKLAADYLQYLMRGGTRTREECMTLAAGGPRYKALGNSMAVPVMRWIGERVDRVERLIREIQEAA